ncbi:MAG: hypothetical protein LBU42_08065, partial [Prevotellaceae bacterium]|nr:hypothetical protein [Prevotellaceae bacterium]
MQTLRAYLMENGEWACASGGILHLKFSLSGNKNRLPTKVATIPSDKNMLATRVATIPRDKNTLATRVATILRGKNTL